MATTLTALNEARSLDELYGVFSENRYSAGWHKKRPSLWSAPTVSFTPQHWRYQDAAVALDRAGEWVGTELAERRNLIMFNPVGDNDYATVRTVISAYQMIKPGEYAKAHRHTPNALRLILDAEPGLYTVVDGVKLPMNAGDVLLTPNWRWHSHYNEGKANGYWLDFLDVPLVHLLEPMFYEQYPGKEQPVTSEPNGHPFAYSRAWALEQLATQPADGNGVRRLVLPTRDYIPTIELSYRQVPTGCRSEATRSTASRVVAVTSGEGHAKIGDLSTEWSRGDVLAVPSWTPFELRARKDALLFEVSDEPTLRMLGFFRDGG
ncbi:MAG: cupin domain-containing protein [Hyphomicrobiales bacterium]|nr:cupin domain-containing protein [Hyphomicrobiales bacterium]